MMVFDCNAFRYDSSYSPSDDSIHFNQLERERKRGTQSEAKTETKIYFSINQI